MLGAGQFLRVVINRSWATCT